MTEEHAVQNEIRIALSPYATVFRANVGKIRTPDGRFFDTGLPKGFSDLFGFRHSDGRIFFIEVKSKTGRTSPEQNYFIEQMHLRGALTGIARSAKDALKIIQEGQ